MRLPGVWHIVRTACTGIVSTREEICNQNPVRLQYVRLSLLLVHCRGLAAGGVALGSKLAMMAKAGGGAGSVLKGIGALTAAGKTGNFVIVEQNHTAV